MAETQEMSVNSFETVSVARFDSPASISIPTAYRPASQRLRIRQVGTLIGIQVATHVTSQAFTRVARTLVPTQPSEAA